MQKEACLIGGGFEEHLYTLVYNRAFEAVGLNVRYKACEIPPKKLANFMGRMRQEEFLGVSVGSLFKQDILNYVNHTTDEARIMGEINTLYYDNKVLVGDNTDSFGIKAALMKVDLRDKTILVYGGGSAAKATLFALQDLGAEAVIVANRTKQRAQILANEFGALVCDSLDLPEVDILINATRVGEKQSNYLLFSEEYLQACELIADMVPAETVLIQTAKKLELEIISGKEILLYQLIRQFELFTGLSAPIEEMAQVLGFKV